MALLFRILGSVFGMLYVAGIVVVAVFFPRSWLAVHLHPAKIVNLLLAAGMLLCWALLRRRPFSVRAVRAFDLVGTTSVSWSICWAAVSAPPWLHAQLGILLFYILTLVLRAAIVPSSPRFTALVGLAGAPAVLASGYVQAASSELSEHIPAAAVVMVMLVWLVAANGVSTVVSRVVFGLVTQVREATRLGQYKLGEKIGEGGMGAVYRAEHAMLRRATALKLLLPGRVGAAALARFEREVRLTSQLSHPNTVAIYDYGRTPKGVFYYAMEYLEGCTLQALVDAEGPQPPGRVVNILTQVAGSLREAHAHGLIHRDIKPSNVILCERGGIPEFVKVIDFGLVKQTEAPEDAAVTRVDAITGTPHFMAPECVTDPAGVTSGVDTYAFGGLAYFLLTGAPPFEGRTMVEVLGRHLHAQPVPPSERLGRELPRKLEALVLRCLEKSEGARPGDAELELLLDECLLESPYRVARAS